MKPRHILPLIAMFLAAFAFSCSSGGSCGDVFTEAEKRIAEHPDTATVAYLDSLAADTTWTKDMRESDRARFALLRVKAADKAYVRHTSDSLIRTALAYYENHTGSDHYPEALYYGGRVYSDLGDLPTALRYFQTAVDAVPNNEENRKLRCHILSQTGRLLDDLRLYDEAATYIKQLLDIEYAMKDSVNVMYNLELLGIVYAHKHDYITADSLFRESLKIARHCKPDYVNREKLYIAKTYLDRQLVDSALNLIRDIPDNIVPKFRPLALSVASEIYYNAEKYDTATVFANRIIQERGPRGLVRNGYNIIFKPELIRTLSEDSLYKRIQNYVSLTEEYLQRNSNEFAAIQNSKFNYQKHDEARIKAEKEKTAREKMLWIISTLFFAFVALAFVVRNRKQKELISLNASLVEFEKIKNHYLYKELIKDNPTEDTGTVVLRDSLREKVISKYEKQKHDMPVLDKEISQSEVYLRLRKLLSENRCLSKDDEQYIWVQLEKAITEASPDFINTLNALADAPLSKNSMEIAMLIRCHFTPKEISTLLGRAKTSISSRRQVLRSKIFENLNDNEVLDYVIWLL